MDVIQRTVSLFERLLQRIKNIGNILVYNYLPTLNEPEDDKGLFWIFNW